MAKMWRVTYCEHKMFETHCVRKDGATGPEFKRIDHDPLDEVQIPEGYEYSLTICCACGEEAHWCD